MGTQWVRTDIDFGCPMVWVRISSRQAMAMAKLSLPSVAEMDPAAMESVVYDLIEELRPEWAGGALFAVRYSIHPMCWEFLLAHRSFAKCQLGAEFPTVNLVD